IQLLRTNVKSQRYRLPRGSRACRAIAVNGEISMMNKLFAFALALGLIAVSMPAMAHHSFQAEYDQSKPLTLVGKLTKVVNENPHGWIYLDAKNAQEKTVNWALETPGPNVLQRNGFNRSVYHAMVESGEEITVTAYPAK